MYTLLILIVFAIVTDSIFIVILALVGKRVKDYKYYTAKIIERENFDGIASRDNRENIGKYVRQCRQTGIWEVRCWQVIYLAPGFIRFILPEKGLRLCWIPATDAMIIEIENQLESGSETLIVITQPVSVMDL